MSNVLVKQVPSYADSKNERHASKLLALISEQKIQVRGIIQTAHEKKFGKAPNGVIPVADVISLAIDNAKEIAECVGKFDRAIKKERAAGEKVQNQS